MGVEVLSKGSTRVFVPDGRHQSVNMTSGGKSGREKKRQRLLRSTSTFRLSGLLLFCSTLKWAVSGGLVSSDTGKNTFFCSSSGINPVYR